MHDNAKKLTRRPGANRGETAKKARRLDPNFAQSLDLREDRGERRHKTAGPPPRRPARGMAAPDR